MICCRRSSANMIPTADYWPSSAHTPGPNRKDANDPTAGDAHLWSVWHGRQPFEWYRTCAHRFNSEFGFQSFPEPATVRGYTLPQDRNVTTYVMEHHQRSGIGNTGHHAVHAGLVPPADALRSDPVAQPDPPGHGDEIRGRALAPGHAARNGDALLATQRLLAGGELGVPSILTAAGRRCITWPAGSTRRCSCPVLRI